MKNNFYAVKRGRVPGIYFTWADCEEQIKGFSNAKFKKFSDKFSAENYINEVEELTLTYPKTGLAVDASLLRKQDIGEYQIFDIDTRKIIFKSGVYKNTTVNIMEFLAIVKALELGLTNDTYSTLDIYSDSATAIVWVYNKKINTINTPNEDTQKEIDFAIELLNNNEFKNQIIKWDTNQLGEIPADYGRK